jgi:hypothetical protein
MMVMMIMIIRTLVNRERGDGLFYYCYYSSSSSYRCCHHRYCASFPFLKWREVLIVMNCQVLIVIDYQ